MAYVINQIDWASKGSRRVEDFRDNLLLEIATSQPSSAWQKNIRETARSFWVFPYNAGLGTVSSGAHVNSRVANFGSWGRDNQASRPTGLHCPEPIVGVNAVETTVATSGTALDGRIAGSTHGTLGADPNPITR
ncbi:hypothetical protein JMJ77_0012193 [Colletotrichum scovillei]|uniref:Uncharacterized protein n=1 Tax=Colletotrichum scovillei TaxID=1209932 RepID=A0A9P7QRW1_9PEZI|nr:hypothetical protein JMJ78_0001244 [Colletotrichum scovillei]KAG7041674.1 hypothetical protein JMJ77_0012193 [Colletotrichum scovillei]KAG7061702.1 hypothetical protein JMJ76_0003661 [Colletotrichum scovillei]